MRVESPTKERLTGGLIFVAALIIIVPEMFSGPDRQREADPAALEDAQAGPQMRTYDMVLDQEGGQEPAQETLAPRPVAPDATEQVTLAAEPVPEPASAPQPAAQPAPVPAAPVAAPVEQEKPAATTRDAPPVLVTAPAPSGRWWVQLGRFSDRANADRLAIELRRAGHNISLSQIRADGKELTLVRAGPVADRAAAAALQKRLSAAGHGESFLVPP